MEQLPLENVEFIEGDRTQDGICSPVEQEFALRAGGVQDDKVGLLLVLIRQHLNNLNLLPLSKTLRKSIEVGKSTISKYTVNKFSVHDIQ